MTTEGGDDGADDTGPFDLYETADGPRHVGSPVRRLILRKMRGAELTVPEMIAATGLTKSTISTHLGVLHKESMVAYREDPEDRRRKFYYLTARHVGTTRRCTDRLPIHAPQQGTRPPAEMGRLVLRALLAELACCGLDLAPLVRETGRRVGELLADGAEATDLARWTEDTAQVWSDAGLGTLRLVRRDPPILEVTSCGLCFPGADRRMSLCSVTQGILEGLASEAFRTAVELEPVPQPSAGASSRECADGSGRITADGPGAPGDRGRSVCGCTFRVRITAAAPHPVDGSA